jgi:hypothetical protein
MLHRACSPYYCRCLQRVYLGTTTRSLGLGGPVLSRIAMTGGAVSSKVGERRLPSTCPSAVSVCMSSTKAVICDHPPRRSPQPPRRAHPYRTRPHASEIPLPAASRCAPRGMRDPARFRPHSHASGHARPGRSGLFREACPLRPAWMEGHGRTGGGVH